MLYEAEDAVTVEVARFRRNARVGMKECIIASFCYLANVKKVMRSETLRVHEKSHGCIRGKKRCMQDTTHMSMMWFWGTL